MPSRAWVGGTRAGVRPAEGGDAERAARAPRDLSGSERDSLGDVGLAAIGRAEQHRRRDVEDQPGRQRAFGDVDADVRLAGAGGHVPVDPAGVVARLVGPDLGELGRRPEGGRAVVARKHARRAAGVR